jgi:hypothetical protein
MSSVLALILAQSLGEYGGIGGSLQEGFFRLRVAANEFLRNTGPRTWIIGCGVLVLVWFFLRGRR